MQAPLQQQHEDVADFLVGQPVVGFAGVEQPADDVIAAYPLPDVSNPFALNTGAGSAKGLLALVAMLGTLVLSTPVTIASLFLTSGTAAWLVLVIGIGYGAGAALLGTYLAGDVLERRGPELLVAITPRR